MKLKLRQIIKDNYPDERVIIDVVENTNLKYYILFDTTYTSDHNISNEHRHSYWFPTQDVKAGDVVVLYTKTGKKSTLTNANGSVSYFFYWKLGTSVWNNDGDAGVLFHTDSWHTLKVGS